MYSNSYSFFILERERRDLELSFLLHQKAGVRLVSSFLLVKFYSAGVSSAGGSSILNIFTTSTEIVFSSPFTDNIILFL